MEFLELMNFPKQYGIHRAVLIFDVKMSINLCDVRSFALRTFPELLELPSLVPTYDVINALC